MADLTFEVAEIPEMESTARVALSGAIDASTVITFQTELDKLKKEGIRRFLLDMAGIRYVNSTGLGSLVKLADGLENEGGMIALMQIHPKVKVVFDMLGLNAFFKIFKTDDEALSFLRDSGSGGADVVEAEPEPFEAPPLAEPVPVAAEPVPMAEPEPMPVAPAPAAPASPAPSGPSFDAPVESACTECGITLRIAGPGHCRCPRCYSTYEVSTDAVVQSLQRRKDIPLQVILTGADAQVEGLACCVETVAKKAGLADGEAASLGKAAGDTCRTITNLAYQGDAKMSYQVLVETGSEGVLLRFADHGTPFDLDAADFQPVREAVSEIKHVPHPRGGNILRIVKKT